MPGFARWALLLSAAPSAIFAQTPAPGEAPPAPVSAEAADDLHHAGHDEPTDVIVTGTRRKVEDVLGGISVLGGEELAADLRPSLGETLARQPGVSATSFGPAASRPILRGLGGERIRILTDGIGNIDLSSSSADHAVAINPLTAERIEILRGPAALLYGSSAIGGAINVIDRRIPRQVPDETVHAEGMASYGTAAHERSANLSLDVPLGAGFVLHGDGNWSKSDELRTGGYLLSDALRDEARASSDPAVAALADLKGKLPNSAARSDELAAGLAYIDGGLNLGLSVSRHHALYGVPIRFSLDPAVEAEAPTLDVAQTRYDARAEVPVGGFLDKVAARAGWSRYGHDELEESGEVGTRFFARGGELRLEAVQAERQGWSGTSGFQHVEKKVRIEGEEKYLPDARLRQSGLFTLQSLERGPLRIEAGGRIEWTRATADADAQLGTPDQARRFTTLSGSVGALYRFGSNMKIGLNLSRSSRAPAPDELFANGPHAGTQAFEIGDPGLDPERSLGVEASLRHDAGPVRGSLTLFASRFASFIYLAPTGAIEDDLPVFEYRQGRARHLGFEAQVEAKLGSAAGIDWGLEALADGVRATIRGFGPAPQIPPLRVSGALTAARGPIDARIEVEHALRQSRTAPLETSTPAYTLVNAEVEWHPLPARPEVTLGVSANNLFDVVARRHASLLKDYAPLAGRDLRLNLRFAY